MFQKKIFTWNKNRVAEHMDSLNLKYKIVPYTQDSQTGGVTMTLTKTDPIFVEHDQDDFEENPKSIIAEDLEEAVRSIYYYDHSYFQQKNVPAKVLPSTNYSGQIDTSENFCLHLTWKNNEVNSKFGDVED